MITRTMVLHEKQQDVSCTCDRCGFVSYGLGISGDHWGDPRQYDGGNFVCLRDRFGYGSLHDNDDVSFDLCEKCFFECMEICKISFQLNANDLL